MTDHDTASDQSAAELASSNEIAANERPSAIARHVTTQHADGVATDPENKASAAHDTMPPVMTEHSVSQDHMRPTAVPPQPVPRDDGKDDRSRHVMTDHDETLRREGYTLSVEDVLMRMERAGVATGKRNVQRFFQQGKFDCTLATTRHGKKYLANALDVDRFIKEMQRKNALALIKPAEPPVIPIQTEPEAVPQAQAPDEGLDTKAIEIEQMRVEMLEARLADKTSTISFLQDQLVAKDMQLSEQSKRFEEQQVLITGLSQNQQPLLAAMARSVEIENDKKERPVTPHYDRPASEGVQLDLD